MNHKSNVSPVRGRRLAFVPVLLLAVFGVWVLLLKERAGVDAAWVKHTEDVSDAATLVASHVRDAETGQRGYIITGVPEYLEPYQRGRDSVEIELEHLRQLTLDNPKQQQLIGMLMPVVRQKMQRIDYTIALRRRGQLDSALAIVRTGTGKRLMDSTLLLISQMRAEENRLLVLRAEKERSDRRMMFIALIAGVALSALFSLLVAFRLSDQAVHQWLVSAELSSRSHVLTEQARVYEDTIRELRQRNKHLEDELDGRKT